jgi:hypothetical protein
MEMVKIPHLSFVPELASKNLSIFPNAWNFTNQEKKEGKLVLMGSTNSFTFTPQVKNQLNFQHQIYQI